MILVVVVTIRLISSILVEHLLSRRIPVVIKSLTRRREMQSDEQEHKRSAHRAMLKDETCNVVLLRYHFGQPHRHFSGEMSKIGLIVECVACDDGSMYTL
jgi:hypothetical protein